MAIKVKIEYLHFRFVDFLFLAKKNHIDRSVVSISQAEWLTGK